jgi:hypothetical protein
MSRRAIEWATTAVCLTLATVVLLTAPFRDQEHDRIVDGKVGESVSSEDVRIEVHDVRIARTAIVRDEEVSSPGLFVIVDATVEALRKPTAIAAELVTADGERSYDPSSRITGDVTIGSLTAGFPQHAALVFELPADAVAGSVLRVDDHSTLGIEVKLEVPLELDDTDVAAGLDRSDPVEMPTGVDQAEIEREYR